MEDSKQSDLIDRTRHAVGAFTTELKTTWRLARMHVEKSNKDVLNIIDKALFVLSLDHEAPNTDADVVQFASHGTSRTNENGIQVGTCTNRYYDKLNLIVTENSIAACVYPASAMDGTTVLRFISDIYTDSVLRLARKINGVFFTLWGDTNTVPIHEDIDKPTFFKLKFQLTPELKTGLHLAETRLADIIHQHEYISRKIEGFGNTYIAQKMNLPPDSLIQTCIQIAYYALYGKMCPSTEPVTTRKFKNARTEPISVQSESMQTLCQTFISQVSNEEKWVALLSAVNEHKKKVVNAMQGNGFERHLSALRSAFIQQEMLYKLHPQLPRIPNNLARVAPPFLFEPSLEALYKPELLVANCGNPALHLFGVTPAIPTGFGIGYIIKDESISFVGSSQWRQTERFLDTLTSVFDEVKNMWKAIVLPHTSVATRATRGGFDSAAGSDNSNYTYQKTRNQQLQEYVSSLPMTMVASNNAMNSKSIDSKQVDDTDHTPTPSHILGGYDYFDVGDFNFRSEMASRAQSRTMTRTNSASNLPVAPMGVGKKLQLNEDY
ncbi:unnamed protein product [Ambrosiozyma monospora]|uniref:Unnamed protein product n=1 Tax=Ambrosiozyma monospora TaxID=43982 RepID=A0ACB5TBR8_AMBMO|nr:unnamed protein product [Ambrosiozyma monospora]